MTRSRTVRTIGVFCFPTSSYNQAIAIAAFQRVRTAGYRPFLIRDEVALAAVHLEVAGYVGLFGPGQAEFLRASGLPAVNVSQAHGASPFPSVLPDNRAAGRLAAEHLLERDYHTIVYVPRPGLVYSELRGAGVRATVKAAGGRYLEWTNQDTAAAWRDLPLPAGLVAADDAVADRVLETAAQQGRHVPDQLAVVGITNDAIECATAVVPLSSVDLNGAVIGDRAARLLLRLIAGRPAPRRPILIAPSGVVTRASSDMLAAADPFVARVVRYARDHLAEGIGVNQLADKFHISRRHLSWLFQRQADYTPVEMLQHLAVARAKQLLAARNLSIAQVAARCGYNNLSHFGLLFRKLTGATPADYRGVEE